MLDFTYYNPAKVIFGSEYKDEIEKIFIEKEVNSLLLIYGGSYVESLGIFDIVKDICNRNNIKLTVNNDVVPNPRVELVRNLIDCCRDNEVNFIIAAGGGSAIDTAKATAIGINYAGDVWDFFEGKGNISKVVPVGVISTISASGSETSNATIINNGLLKKGFEDDRIIPSFAVLNPQYTLTLPDFQTASGIADILSHLLERYLTNEKYVDTTDYLIEGAIKALLLNGRRVIKKPDDYNARAEIQWLASIAHNNLLDTGRETDWASHRVEHELSAQYDLTHGQGMAIVLLAYFKFVSEKNPTKLAQLANRVFGIDYLNYSEKEMVEILIERFKEFFEYIGLKTSLSQLDITDEHFKEMAARATNEDEFKVGHYYPLDSKLIIEVLKLAS